MATPTNPQAPSTRVRRFAQLLVLEIALLVGLVGILVLGARQNARQREAFKYARSDYQTALTEFAALVPPGKGGPRPMPYGAMIVQAQGHNLDVWSWAHHTAVAARVLAGASVRLAASVSELDPGPHEASVFRVDAEVLTANAASIARTVEDALSASTTDSLDTAKPISREIDRAANARDPSTVHRPLATADDTAFAIPPKIAIRRLALFIGLAREQRRLGYELDRTAGRFASTSTRANPTTWGSRVQQAFHGQIASAVWQTLAVSAAIALIVLAFASLVTAVLKRFGIPGTTDVEGFRISDAMPLGAAVIVPLIAAPYLFPVVTSTPGATTSSAAGATNVMVRPMHAGGLQPAGPDIIVEDPSEARATREAIFAALTAQQIALRGQRSDLRDALSVTAALAAGLEKRFRNDSATVQAQLARAESDRRDAHERDSVLSTRLAQSVAQLSTVTEGLLEPARNIRPPVNTLMGVAWLTECLRLREEHRALPVRAWHSVVGSGDKAEVMRALRDANGDMTAAAQRVCADASIVEAKMPNAPEGSQLSRY